MSPLYTSAIAHTQKDLEHHKCNSVYRPWVNKGGRRSNTLRNAVGTSAPYAPHLSLLVVLSSGTVRKNCKYTHPPLPSRPSSTHRKGSGEANVHYPGMTQQLNQPVVICPTPVPMRWIEDSDKHCGERTTSPERQFVCEGWCRTTMPKKATLEHADVVRWILNHPSIPSYLPPCFLQISISSSNDGQISWDASTRNGDSISMTTVRWSCLSVVAQRSLTVHFTVFN